MRTPMMWPECDADAVWAAEEKLARHPAFGDAERIQRRTHARYRFAVEILGTRSASIAESALSLTDGDADRMWRDPVVRKALEEGLQRLERDEANAPDDLAIVLDLARDRLTRSRDLMPTQFEDDLVLRAGPGGRIWLPSMTGQPGPLLSRLRKAMIDKFIGHNELSGQFQPADSAAARSIDQAGELLTAVLPQLGDGVLDHIAAVGLLTGSGPKGRQLSAAGGDHVPGMIVLDPSLLESVWTTAGILLHEGLHLKAFDITRSFSLLSAPPVMVEIPWRHAHWPVRRVLFAFHVYAHVALFQAAAAYRAAELSDRFGVPPENVAVSRGAAGTYASAVERAQFLGARLAGDLEDGLTADGRRFVGWLLESTAPLVNWRRPSESNLATRPSAGGADELGESSPPVPRYVRPAGIIVRPVPDLEIAFAYNPGDRVLSCLNLSAWAAFELCDGRADIESDYRDLVRARLRPAQASHQLRLALRQLTARGLIEMTEGGDPL
jgi:hypothetical protein